MEEFFKLKYEFDKEKVDTAIEAQLNRGESGYICVSDGVVLDTAFNNAEYRKAVNGSIFSLCDSSWVPVYLRLIYGIKREQYCGHDLFCHIVGKKKYRMMFLGSSRRLLDPLKEKLLETNPEVADMQFIELPYASVDEFDYKGIGDTINKDNPDIIWVSLGAPKQEMFMSRLAPYVDRGVMISVGAVFKFVTGVDAHRAPKWMIRSHIEFLHRIFVEPRKQSKRVFSILSSLPKILRYEYAKKGQKS